MHARNLGVARRAVCRWLRRRAMALAAKAERCPDAAADPPHDRRSAKATFANDVRSRKGAQHLGYLYGTLVDHRSRKGAARSLWELVPTFAKVRATSGGSCPGLARASTEVCPISAQFGPKPTKLDRSAAHCDQQWPGMDRNWPEVAQAWLGSDKFWATWRGGTAVLERFLSWACLGVAVHRKSALGLPMAGPTFEQPELRTARGAQLDDAPFIRFRCWRRSRVGRCHPARSGSCQTAGPTAPLPPPGRHPFVSGLSTPSCTHNSPRRPRCGNRGTRARLPHRGRRKRSCEGNAMLRAQGVAT